MANQRQKKPSAWPRRNRSRGRGHRLDPLPGSAEATSRPVVQRVRPPNPTLPSPALPAKKTYRAPTKATIMRTDLGDMIRVRVKVSQIKKRVVTLDDYGSFSLASGASTQHIGICLDPRSLAAIRRHVASPQ